MEQGEHLCLVGNGGREAEKVSLEAKEKEERYCHESQGRKERVSR